MLLSKWFDSKSIKKIYETQMNILLKNIPFIAQIKVCTWKKP